MLLSLKTLVEESRIGDFIAGITKRIKINSLDWNEVKEALEQVFISQQVKFLNTIIYFNPNFFPEALKDYQTDYEKRKIIGFNNDDPIGLFDLEQLWLREVAEGCCKHNRLEMLVSFIGTYRKRMFEFITSYSDHIDRHKPNTEELNHTCHEEEIRTGVAVFNPRLNFYEYVMMYILKYDHKEWLEVIEIKPCYQFRGIVAAGHLKLTPPGITYKLLDSFKDFFPDQKKKILEILHSLIKKEYSTTDILYTEYLDYIWKFFSKTSEDLFLAYITHFH